MEVVSSRACSLPAASAPFLPSAHHNYHHRTPSHSAPIIVPPFPNLSATAAAAAAVKTQSHHRYPTKPPLRISSPPRPHAYHLAAPPVRRAVHRSASTGYAAALLDAALCDGVLAVAGVERDARRLLRGLRVIPALEDGTKGEVVRRVAEGGGFSRLVVALVKMLVAKGRVGMVEEVMEEFGRICDEVSGTRVVEVSSEGEMEEERLREIAREVQRTSGAPKVRVRHVRVLPLPAN